MPVPLPTTLTAGGVLAAISYLLAGLGLSAVAGLRAYLPLLALGIASHVSGPGGQPYLHVQPNFAAVGSPLVIAGLALLALGEFLGDKIPLVDHLIDLTHTAIRPISGAIILAGLQNPLSDHSQLAAGVVGAALAFGVHAIKAGTRPAVTVTTAGTMNPLVSLLEDVLALLLIVLLIAVPVVGFIVAIALALLLWRAVRALYRRIVGHRRRGGARALPPTAPPAPAPQPTAPLWGQSPVTVPGYGSSETAPTIPDGYGGGSYGGYADAPDTPYVP